MSCAQPTEKFFLQTNGTDGKRILRRCAFWGSHPQMGNPKPEKKWVPDIHFVYLSDVKKIRWIQLWNYFSNPTKSDGVIAGRLGQGRIQAYEKHRNVPLTPVIYNITARSQWHKCVGCGLWCAVKIWKFLTREEPKPKNGRTSGILRTYRKKF